MADVHCTVGAELILYTEEKQFYLIFPKDPTNSHRQNLTSKLKSKKPELIFLLMVLT